MRSAKKICFNARAPRRVRANAASERRARPEIRGGAGIARKGIIVALAASLLSTSSAAHAAPGDDADVRARYAFLDAELARGESYARAWWTLWTIGYSAVVAGSLGFGALTTSYDLRVDAYTDAAKSALGLGSVVFTLRAPFRAPGELAAMDASTADARALRLARAEALLDESAAAETLSTSWLAHLASLGVNVGGAAILWFGYGQRGIAIVDMAVGIAVGELQIETTPTDAVDSLRRYRAGDFTPRAEHRLTWSITPAPGGAGVRVAF